LKVIKAIIIIKAPAADPSACNNHLSFPSLMTLVNHVTPFWLVDKDCHYATHSKKIESTHAWCALGSLFNCVLLTLLLVLAWMLSLQECTARKPFFSKNESVGF